jgi:hypothetical protein
VARLAVALAAIALVAARAWEAVGPHGTPASPPVRDSRERVATGPRVPALPPPARPRTRGSGPHRPRAHLPHGSTPRRLPPAPRMAAAPAPVAVVPAPRIVSAPHQSQRPAPSLPGEFSPEVEPTR